MESKTSPKSATWRWRKTGCVVQSKSESLRTRGAHGRNPSPGTGEDKRRCPSSRTETEKTKNSSFSSCSVHVLNRLDDTHLHGGGKFTESHHPNANITWKPSHRHIRKKCLVNIWAPCDALKLTCKINHHTFQSFFKIILKLSNISFKITILSFPSNFTISPFNFEM